MDRLPTAVSNLWTVFLLSAVVWGLRALRFLLAFSFVEFAVLAIRALEGPFRKGYLEFCCILCTLRLISIGIAFDVWRKNIPMSGVCLMLSLDAFLPSLAAAKLFSHAFNSRRSIFDFCSSSVFAESSISYLSRI